MGLHKGSCDKTNKHRKAYSCGDIAGRMAHCPQRQLMPNLAKTGGLLSLLLRESAAQAATSLKNATALITAVTSSTRNDPCQLLSFS
jgi:hypothetical protein